MSDGSDKLERKLRLVRPEEGAAAPEVDADFAPPTAEELQQAAALRDAIERGDEPVSCALRAAYAPAALELEDHDALIRAAFEGTTDVRKIDGERERAEAARLRDELARPESPKDGELARLARALAAAASPREIDPLKNEALVARALGKRRGRGRDVAAAVVGVLALAAGIVLAFRTSDTSPPPPVASVRAPSERAVAALARSRSTMDLFDPAAPFPRSGGESSRMDRIAASRIADLRANRFRTWRVPEAGP